MFETMLPIIFLIGLGFISRKLDILKSGDERVFSAYVYYFALPSLFIVNLSETDLNLETFRFIIAGITPILIIVTSYTFIYLAFKIKKDSFFLLVLSTIFGSLAFFGIPFITFAFPTVEAEHLATLSAASTSIVSVTISITILELFDLNSLRLIDKIKSVLKRLIINPLILSIIFGITLSLTRIKIPLLLFNTLNIIGETTSTVAIFMLGVFLYGRKYSYLITAFKLSLLRIIVLPVIAIATTMLIGLNGLEGSIVVLMSNMPVAISMIVLSERYNFYKEIIASLIMISSLGSGLYLNLWLEIINLI
jgi:predicted permease